MYISSLTSRQNVRSIIEQSPASPFSISHALEPIYPDQPSEESEASRTNTQAAKSGWAMCGVSNYVAVDLSTKAVYNRRHPVCRSPTHK